MASVELAQEAAQSLTELVASHHLPADTRTRVAGSLRTLKRFPLAGRLVPGDSGGLRFIVGPWRWLVITYEYDESRGKVSVMEFRDARSSTWPGRKN